MKKCLICETAIKPFLLFGNMPIANGFLTQKQFASEYFSPLSVGFCSVCSMVQLLELVDREKMFHKEYAFYSSTSSFMAKHFQAWANELLSSQFLFGQEDPYIVEIGSNDGIFLEHIAKQGIRHLGVEPSANVAKVAMNKGINTLSEFFDEELVQTILDQYRQADAIVSANVICHIPYLHSIFAGVKTLLKPHGIFTFEEPYLLDILEKTSYDQIYDEHAFYFSVSSISYIAKMHGLEIIEVSEQNVHGGSMRYTLAHVGAYSISKKVFSQKKKEQIARVEKLSTYKRFAKNVSQSKKKLLQLLVKLKKEGKQVVGYGATSKSTTVTNYCGITTDLVSCIYDTTPIKIGKYSPGVHIPIKNYSEFQSSYPEYALLFAWNHKKEIMEKEKAFLQHGGKFIVYVPEVSILSSAI